MERHKPIFFAILILIITATMALGQQGNTGEIRGTVFDEQGAAVSGAKIVVKNVNTGIEREITSDSRGRYRAILLPVGVYEVAVEKERFKKWVQSGITVQVGDILAVDATLEVGEFTTVVTITGDAPIIEVNRTTVSSVVSEELIENLPINGRDYRDFVLVTPTAGTSDRNGVTLAGSRGMYTNLTMDGADNSSPFFSEQNGGEIDPTFTVSQESVKEFRVLNNGFSAEYGRSIGGMINVVTKSGTNDYRGSGFFFFQNESLVSDQKTSTNFGEDFTYDPQDKFSRKQFGGSLGGPIQKDKSFFFLSTDVQRYEIPRVIRFTWSEAERAAHPEIAALEENYVSTDDDIVFFGKLDYQISDAHSLSVRFNYSDANQENGLGYYADDALSAQGKEDESTTSTVGTLTSFFGDNMINEFRVQYATNTIDRVNNGDGPEIRVSGLGYLGATWYLPITIDVWRWQFTDNFNWLIQDHDIKFGIDYNLTNTDEVFIGYSRGQVRFTSLANYLSGRVYYALQKVPLGGRSMRESGSFTAKVHEVAFYAQDKWQPTEQLTVDLGLRWEGTFNPNPPTTNPLFPLTGQLFDDKNNWQPRAGVAYDLEGDGKTVLRAAGGLFFGRTPSILYFNPFNNNGVISVVQYVPGYAVPWPYDSQAVIDSVTSVGVLDIDFVNPNYEESEVWRFNAGVERELLPNTSLSLDFLYAKGNKLMRRHDVNFNPPTPGAATNGRDLYDRRNRPNTDFGRLSELTSTGKMEYYGFTALLKSRLAYGITTQASYTLSKSKDDDSNERSSGGTTYTEPFNPEADYGLSDYDRTHRIVASVVWNAPYDINVSGIFTWMSGRPYSALWGTDLNGDGESNDRAEPGSGGTVWVERNTYRRDSFTNIDLRLSKIFQIDRYRIEGIFEAFNLLNTESITGVYNTSRYSSFGLPSNYQDSRRLQLGARVRF